ncbi:DUF4288 domain-containing protein [Lederbergia lenta]|uniref:DUF4288 domain-containing protein n=1 Tax=Lederbergia lenta TaxID=1467 RepID=A0A2X4VN76_LEDLE|nr:DUF4288 domain-containing protein [Lederbergia lenta]MEC2323681.1 DUF4288 domain-containing protein [Lederbergia lenta]SQI51639.1 Uncharacterised protein [Lederbergia lenta]
MYDIYSVKLLFESIVSPNPSPEKTFEERIILIKSDNIEDINQMVYDHFKPETYPNSEGGLTTLKLVNDVFELVDDLNDSVNFKEVYSRHLLFDQEITFEKVVNLFSLDK